MLWLHQIHTPSRSAILGKIRPEPAREALPPPKRYAPLRVCGKTTAR
jgi:hypothetical protein